MSEASNFIIRSSSQQPSGNAGFFSSVFNLMNAILGAGIVGLPYSLNNLGYVSFTISLLIVAAIALFAINILLILCEKENTSSYVELSEKAFGRTGKLYTSSVIIVHCLIALCGFMFIVKLEGPSFLRGLLGVDLCTYSEETLPWYLNGNNLAVFTIWTIVMPLSCAKNIDFLGFSSGIGMACMLIFTGIVITYRYIIECPVRAWKGAESFFQDFETIQNQSLSLNSNSDESVASCAMSNHQLHFGELAKTQVCEGQSFVFNKNSIYAIPTMLFAFQCHASCLPIYTELKQRCRKNMLRIAFTSIGAVLAIYGIVSFFAYNTWYNITMDEVLIMYTSLNASDPLVLIARGCVIICVIFSTPLLHFPCRKAQTVMFFPETTKNEESFSWFVHLGFMVLNLLITHLVVIYIPQIRTFFSYGGAVTANSLVIILPSCFYIKLTGKEHDLPGKQKYSVGGSAFYDAPKTRMFAIIFAVFGSVFLVCNTAMLLWKDLGFSGTGH